MTDIMLFLLFAASLIYCCDLPLLFDIPFLVNDHGSMIYSVGLSIIAAYIIYFFQTFPSFVKKKIKYNAFIEQKLLEIDELMVQTIRIVAHCNYDDSKKCEIENIIKKQLEHINIFEDGSRTYKDNDELLFIDGILENELKIHNNVLELISLGILGKKTVDVLLEIEKLQLREFASTYASVKPGKLTTVEQRKGQSYGGLMVYNTDYLKKRFCEIMKEYIRAMSILRTYRSSLGGSGIRVIISNLRL